MDTDKEIETILKDISIKDVRSFDDIKQTNQLAIDTAYSEYLKYDINKENKKKVELFIHNGYEYIELTDSTPTGWVCYIDTSKFYNIKIHMSGLFLKFKSNNTVILKLNNRYYNVNIHNKIFFRKISNKDILKIHLIEAIKKN